MNATTKPTNNFRDRPLPEPATPVGYAHLIDKHDLETPLPKKLTAIAERHHPKSTDAWQLLTPRHRPGESLQAQLEFALKWEGIDLGVLAALFRNVSDAAIAEIVRNTPTGAYSRRLWFLYEWLTGTELDISSPGKVRSVPVVNPKQQVGLIGGERSSRHKVINNLPGTAAFCPLVRKTDLIVAFQEKRLDEHAREVIGRIPEDFLARAAAQLELSDSRSSFDIEGERPSPKRAQRWGKAIGKAGSRPLSIDELERLQSIVIGDARFVELGLRTEGGFIGERDRLSQRPLPGHISARPDDLEDLLNGVIAFGERALAGQLDPVVTAAAIAFGFVYIHPFVDGNGRLHRWLIHHALSIAGYNPPGLIFPVSVPIVRDVDRYLEVLQSYSKTLLPLIEWEETPDHNIEVLNETVDYYRYFDATEHAEFLFSCVEETIDRDLPGQVAYLRAFDCFEAGVQEIVDMPRRTIELLNQFLRQGDGHIPKRRRSREFEKLEDAEVELIERLYQDCFAEVPPEAFK